MLKKFSKYLAFTLVFIFMSSSIALASPIEVVSIQEYEKAMKAEFEKYDIVYEVCDYDPNVTITRDMLNSSLASIKKTADNLNNVQVIDVPEKSSIITPNMMPITKNYPKDFSINPNRLALATIRAQVNLTYDGSNMEVISVNSKSASEYGYHLNLVYYNTKSMTVNTSNNYFSVNIVGAIKFEWEDPITGVKAGYTNNNLQLEWGQKL